MNSFTADITGYVTLHFGHIKGGSLSKECPLRTGSTKSNILKLSIVPQLCQTYPVFVSWIILQLKYGLILGTELPRDHSTHPVLICTRFYCESVLIYTRV